MAFLFAYSETKPNDKFIVYLIISASLNKVCDNLINECCIFPAPTSTCSNGDVRLVNGSTPLEGRVEVCIGQQWGAVCGDGRWTRDTSGANTVCEQLGYSPSNATVYVYPHFGSYAGGIFLLNVQCDARAGRLVDCSYSYQSGFQYCYDWSTAGVRCQGKIKFIGEI